MSAFQNIINSSYYLVAYRYSTRILGFFTLLYVARIIPPEEFGNFTVVISFLAIVDSLISLPFENSIIQSTKLGKKDINSIWTYSRFLRSIFLFFIFNLIVTFFNFKFFIDDKNLYYIASLSILGNGLYNTYISQSVRNIDYKGDMVSSFLGRFSRLLLLIVLCTYFKNAYALVISWLIEIYIKSLSSYFVSKKKVSFSLDVNPIRKHLKYSIYAYFVNLFDQLMLNLDNLLAVSFIGIKFAGFFQATKRVNAEFTADFKMILEKILFPLYSRIQKKNKEILNNINLYFPLLIYLAGITTLIAFLLIEDLIKIVLGEKWIDIIVLCKIFLIYGFFNILNVQARSILRALAIQKYIIYSSITYLILITLLSYNFYYFKLLDEKLFVFIISFAYAVSVIINIYFVKISIGLNILRFFKKNFVSFFSLICTLSILLILDFKYLNNLNNYILILFIKFIIILILIFKLFIFYK